MYILYTIIYNIIIYCIQPLIWIRLLWRSIKIPKYRKNLLERYGFYINHYTKPNGIMIHAVSLGETLSVIPFIKSIRKKYPNITITLTFMTPSALELSKKLISNNYNVQCIYLPYDLIGAMKRFINKIKPKLVIIIETELWPNFINILHHHKIPIIIANARLSIHSFIKYKKINKFFLYIIKKITIVAAQDKTDANRFLQLGLKPDQLNIMGNLKFDITLTHNMLHKIKILKNTWTQGRLTWIASSTHEGEELLLLAVHKKLLEKFPNLLMILAPRHPRRFLYVSKITKKFGFSYIMKSSGIIPTKKIQVIINDTIGELMLLYGISDIAFIGGSLVNHGGHNPLEPAAHNIPIITGPYIFNFQDIYVKLRKLNGLFDISDSKSLITTISSLLKNKELRIYYGNCAAKIFHENKGALQKLLNLLQNYIPKKY